MKERFLAQLSKAQIRNVANAVRSGNYAKVSAAKCTRIILNSDLSYKQMVALAYVK